MENRIFKHNGNNITFEMNSDENVMINATDMAKAFNKDVFGFLRLDSTKEYINAYCQTADLRSENEFTPNGKLIKVVNGGSQQRHMDGAERGSQICCLAKSLF